MWWYFKDAIFPKDTAQSNYYLSTDDQQYFKRKEKLPKIIKYKYNDTRDTYLKYTPNID